MEHVRHQSKFALVIIDVLNEFNFPNAENLLRLAIPMAKQLARLKKTVKQHKIPVIYANDNFGQWQSDRRQVISHCSTQGCRGRPVAQLLLPDADDYFVLKPKYSAFFSTTLETLLGHLGSKILILTGLAGNICVLHTAFDAHSRGFDLVVPKDCIASYPKRDHDFALRQFKNVISADIRTSETWINKLKNA